MNRKRCDNARITLFATCFSWKAIQRQKVPKSGVRTVWLVLIVNEYKKNKKAANPNNETMAYLKQTLFLLFALFEQLSVPLGPSIGITRKLTSSTQSKITIQWKKLKDMLTRSSRTFWAISRCVCVFSFQWKISIDHSFSKIFCCVKFFPFC